MDERMAAALDIGAIPGPAAKEDPRETRWSFFGDVMMVEVGKRSLYVFASLSFSRTGVPDRVLLFSSELPC